MTEETKRGLLGILAGWGFVLAFVGLVVFFPSALLGVMLILAVGAITAAFFFLGANS